MRNRDRLKEKPKSSLRDLIDSIDWMGIEVHRGIARLSLDAVAVQFTRSKRKKSEPWGERADLVRVRIGQKVLEELGWEIGSKIFVAYDPDDELTFLLTQVETNGYVLGQESGSHAGRVHFKWGSERISMGTCPAKNVEYEVYKKQLIFRAPSS